MKTWLPVCAAMVFLCACTPRTGIAELSLEETAAAVQPPLRDGVYDYLIAPIPAGHTAFTIESVRVPAGTALEVDGVRLGPGVPVRFENLKPGPNPHTLSLVSRGGKNTVYRFTLYRALPVLDDNMDNRFLDAGDGTILDTATGLVWMKDADLPELVTWEGARSFVERLNGGSPENITPYRDWRLPDVVELRSLANRTADDPSAWLEARGFTNVNALYWTSTPYAPGPDRVWTVLLPHTHTPLARSKTGYCWVWPVRSSSNLPESGSGITESSGRHDAARPVPRFRAGGDGTVIDNMTGLVWLDGVEAPGELRSWEETVSRVDSLNDGNVLPGTPYRDWRIPSMRELDTLIDFGVPDGIARLTAPGTGFVSVGTFSWSRDPYPDGGRGELMWGMVMMNGVDGSLTKDLMRVGVLPVRGGEE